jgi:hypothetical protein
MKDRVCVCRECGNAFPRYRRDHPPKGFCSVACHDEHAKAHPPYTPGRIPLFVVSLIKEHLDKMHHTADVNAWFDGCVECDRLQASYAQALNTAIASVPAAAR